MKAREQLLLSEGIWNSHPKAKPSPKSTDESATEHAADDAIVPTGACQVCAICQPSPGAAIQPKLVGDGKPAGRE